MLVQYRRPRWRKPGQVVPDNMVVLTNQPIRAQTSYNVPLEPARPFWVLDYISKSHKRKDYEDRFDKYERALKVPYYLTFYADEQELTLYRHGGERYQAVPPNQNGRYLIPELDLEVGRLDGWARFWYQGDRLLLPADLLRQIEDAQRRTADAEKRRADALARLAQHESRAAADAD